jgi:hypothetical protein
MKANFGRVARYTGMPFAVDLDKIRLYGRKKCVNHGIGESLASIGDIFRGVQIEMNAKKAVSSA